MKKILLLALSSLFLTSTAFANLHFVHLKANDHQIRSKIANIIHIDQVVEDSVYAVVNEDDLKELRKQMGNLLVETHEFVVPKKKAGDEIEFPRKDEKFHTYDNQPRIHI